MPNDVQSMTYNASQLTQALGALHRSLTHGLPDRMTLAEKAEVLGHLDLALGTLKGLRGPLATEVAKGVHGRSKTVAPGVRVEITPGALRHEYDDQRVIEALAGQVVPGKPRIAAKLGEALSECARLDWRKRALAEHGVLADLYSEDSRGAPGVRVDLAD